MHNDLRYSAGIAAKAAAMPAAAFMFLVIGASEARADALVYGCPTTTEKPTFAQASGFCQFSAFGTTTFGSATADLPGGVLRADAIGRSVNAHDIFGNPIITSLGGTADAQIDDTVTVHGGTSWTSPIPVTLSLHVDGELLGLAGASAFISLTAGASQENVLASWDGVFARLQADGNGTASVPNGAPPTVLVPIGSGVHHANTGDGVLIGFNLSVTTEVDPSDPTFAIEAVLGALADPENALFVGENEADFADTAQLGVTLPDGFSFTSGSGVLLDAVAVPEPASFGLMFVGLVGLVALRHRPTRRWAAA